MSLPCNIWDILRLKNDLSKIQIWLCILCVLFGNTTQNQNLGTQRCLEFKNYVYIQAPFDNSWIFHAFFKNLELGKRREFIFFFSLVSWNVCVVLLSWILVNIPYL